MSKSYRNTSNRRFKYLINQETKRKNIAEYKSLCWTYSEVIAKLPYKKRVLIQAELEAAER